MTSNASKTAKASRFMTLGKLGLGIAGSAVAAAGRRLGGVDPSLAFHTKTAGRLLATLGNLKGLPMKVGQILSFMDGVLPPEFQDVYRETLGRLQVKVEPVAWPIMRAQLERELGRPVEGVFAALDVEPIAAASLGQVYAARLPDGREVAVKVQYPGIDAAVSSDLSILKGLTTVVETMLPRVDIEQLRHDVVSRFAEECDYVREAANQRSFRALWADDPRVVVPLLVDELCTRRVLVSELHRGQTFAELLATGDEARRSGIGSTLFTFTMRSILRHGLFNSDPHPGNFLFPGGDQVVFLDFGSVQRYDDAGRTALAELRDALIERRQGDAWWSTICRVLAMDPGTSLAQRRLVEAYLAFCFEPILARQPYRYTAEYTAGLAELTARTKVALLKNAWRDGWQEPKREGVVMFSRILFGMNSLLASLGARADWRAILAGIQ